LTQNNNNYNNGTQGQLRRVLDPVLNSRFLLDFWPASLGCLWPTVQGYDSLWLMLWHSGTETAACGWRSGGWLNRIELALEAGVVASRWLAGGWLNRIELALEAGVVASRWLAGG
jgi:hypothetical protein